MATFPKLSVQELNRIKKTVFKAESKISGEIRPALVRQSHHYPSVKWKSAALFALVGFMMLVAGDRWVPGFNIYDPLYYFFIVTGIGSVGALLPFWIPSFKAFLVTDAEKKHAAVQKAETVFLEEEIFDTQQRTGILIFISFLEHEVIVMTDSGIANVVDQKTWDDLTNNLTSYIKRGLLVEGLSKAIESCGDILLEKGFKKEEGDQNELPDHLRLEL
ncbi:hypothetical protein JMN32_25715 [Fulvivirga sp. 29W222]|uniref:TPM domain-containing protein n=1 Tax=Fulvivirga marina TaxID=2494733 RepID=A0A937KEM1_9BACT|nr:TPM domain-containing protein [Fulvivirga marina]MBL6449734.1 hypothetical protein [Fulvivirga marina]